jgi:hypothetical protein
VIVSVLPDIVAGPLVTEKFTASPELELAESVRALADGL